MNSDNARPLQAGQPSLPPVAPAPTPGQPAPVPTHAALPSAAPTPLAPEELAARAAAEARKIVETYQSNPYVQAQALAQLKAQYLRDRYHINLDMAGQ